MKNKKGISLIVLIITIIIVIVLAAVVILTLSKNNPVTGANEATFKSDIRSFQEELSMYISKEIIKDYSGTREKLETPDLPSKENMKKYVSSFSKKYENKIGIYEDEIVYYKPKEDVKNKVTEKEEKWLQDLGIKLKTIQFEWGSDDPNTPAYHTLVKYIGDENEVVVPKRCHEIGSKAFKGSSVKSVVLQEGVIYIGTNSFEDCYYLAKITLPNSLTSIGSFAFSGCRSLNSIKLSPNIRAINSCAFFSCPNLEEVILPDNLFGIHNEAFKSCTKLKNITLPETVGYLGKSAFYNSGIQSINIPANLINIEEGSFSECKNLISINVDNNNPCWTDVDGVLYSKDKTILKQFPAGKSGSYSVLNETTNIENNAFYGCDKLEYVTLQENVTKIGSYCFNLCTNLQKINIPLSVESMGAWAIGYCNKVVINCEIEEENLPEGWSKTWNPYNRPVNWGVENLIYK